MSGDKKILLSGVKPSGTVHIGNYFGALKQFVDFQNDYRALIMIADLHALTTLHDPAELRKNILELTAAYLAIGLDPEKVTLFKQSDILEHTQAAWIFSCLTTMPYLMRSHAFKDAETKNKEVNTGLFTYPILMAADILLYSPDVVPVGQDQKQHLEIARDMAEKFNRVYGEVFKLPEPLILENVKTVVGLDGQKMSKSYHNTIPLFATERELKQLVMSMKTDSKGEEEPKNPEECGVFALHKLFSQADLAELKKRYVEGKIGYKESKEILAKNMNAYLAPMREKYDFLIKDEKSLSDILANGANSAREIASAKMAEMRKSVGVSF
ncbi:tryptophan--tRNA ligase [Candidatus Nomurabacteria bacterium]|nr:tryptophan--tRNA ligase [Candidatus Nomurabacteria bacterium]